MSNIGISIHWVNALHLIPFCDQAGGAKTFRLALNTAAQPWDRTPEGGNEEISVHVEACAVAKFERIAAAINSIMSEPDDASDAASAPMVEAFSAE